MACGRNTGVGSLNMGNAKRTGSSNPLCSSNEALRTRCLRTTPYRRRLGKSAMRVCLGLEQITSPSPTASKVDLAVVQAMFAVRPELDRVRTHAEPGPERRSRDFVASELPGEPRAPREKFRARAKPSTLMRRARRKL